MKAGAGDFIAAMSNIGGIIENPEIFGG